MNDRERKHIEDQLSFLRNERTFVVAAKQTKEENNWPADKETARLAELDTEIVRLEAKLKGDS